MEFSVAADSKKNDILLAKGRLMRTQRSSRSISKISLRMKLFERLSVAQEVNSLKPKEPAAKSGAYLAKSGAYLAKSGGYLANRADNIKAASTRWTGPSPRRRRHFQTRSW